MNEVRLRTTLDNLFKIITVSDEKKEELFSRYMEMSDTEAIKHLSTIIHTNLSSDKELYDYALTSIRNINPDICPSLEEMKEVLSNMFFNQVAGNMSMEENHKLVSDTLRVCCTLLNESGVDYYIVGALPCFLKTGEPLFRYHDDIDIMINEDDMEKVMGIVDEMGYIFHDDRFPSKERFEEMEKDKPPHTVLAQNPDNEFHLGFFCFRREEDKSLTMREYSHRIEGGEVVVDVLERRSSPFETGLRYDEVPTIYMETEFRTSTLESVYNLKSYTKRPKDLTDISKLEPFIDKDKLKILQQEKTESVLLTNVTKETTAVKGK